MSSEEAARKLADRLREEGNRENVIAQKALLDDRVKRSRAPETWDDLVDWLRTTVYRANGCLGQSAIVVNDEVPNKLILHTRLGGSKTVEVLFNPEIGRISYGRKGHDHNRFEPTIDGSDFCFSNGSRNMQTHDLGEEILALL